MILTNLLSCLIVTTSLFRFHAATLSLSLLGLASDIKSDDFEKKVKLLRHQDGPNDERPGLHCTVIYWVVFEYQGKVWRLAIIFYSRRSVGDAMERENKWMKPAIATVENYLQSLNFTEYLCCEWSDLEENYINQYGVGEVWEMKQNRALPDSDGYISITVDAILRLIKEYNLDDGTAGNYKRICELCFIAILMNCQWTTAYVFHRWLRNGASPWDLNKKGRPICDDLIELYRSECMDKLGLSSPFKKAGKETHPRMQSSNPMFFLSADKKEHNELMNQFMAVISYANEHTYEEVMLKLHGKPENKTTKNYIEYLGRVTSLQLYPFLVFVGLIHTELGRLNSVQATIAPLSAYGKDLTSRGCEHAYQRKSILHRLSLKWNMLPYRMENLLCKAHRRNNAYDVFRQDQLIFCRDKVTTKDGRSVIVLRQRKLDQGGEWTEYDPKICMPVDVKRRIPDLSNK